MAHLSSICFLVSPGDGTSDETRSRALLVHGPRLEGRGLKSSIVAPLRNVIPQAGK